MKQYEQMELDTRKALDRAVAGLAKETVETVKEMAQACGERRTAVRNSHEAYGIAAEQFCRIAASCKRVSKDVDGLLNTLGNPNYNAVEAVSSIVNSSMEAATILLLATAEMKQTMEDLYAVETAAASEPTPMEQLAAGDAGIFEEATATVVDEAAADAETGADE